MHPKRTNTPEMGAAAMVTLPPPASGATPQARFIRLTDVGGRTFSATLDSKTPGQRPGCIPDSGIQPIADPVIEPSRRFGTVS
jgi:hypothetical protein